MNKRWNGASRRTLVAAAAAAGVAPAAMAPATPVQAPADPGPVQLNCDELWQREGSGWYEDNPTYTDPYDDQNDWRFSTPEAHGIDGDLLEAGVDELVANDSLLSVIVISDGELVFERYANGGTRDSSNNVHSASKSILQALIGIAIAEGRIDSLDDRASSYLPDAFRSESAAKQDITIGQLLTMTSGLAWVEDETEYRIEERRNWVREVIRQPLRHTPGTKFNYSTGNTHVLSAVLQAATGMTTCQYAQDRLFAPLGITAEHWGRDPQGVFSGGYNLYLTPREIAKFGQLYLQGGVWDGQQLVPSETVAEAETPISDDGDGFLYSSGWWARIISGYDMHFAWGWGGQFVYVIPELDLVFATTQNTHVDHEGEEVDSGSFIRDVLIPSAEHRR